MSRRPCSTGGLAEEDFGLGCRDENTHTAADGRPYIANGYDVLGQVYPAGSGGASGTREVSGVTNFMDTTGALDGGPYDRWVDNLSYDWLTQQLRNPADPELISLSGMITVPGGPATPNGNPITGALLPSFRYMGIPDRPEAVLNDPNGIGEGQFGVRLVTPSGSRLYRVTPGFTGEGNQSGEHGYFSMSVIWDPATTRIELVGPSNPAELGQKSSAIVLAARDLTPKAPTVANLRATVNGKAATRGAGLPTAGSAQSILIGWDQADSDTPAASLSAILYVIPPQALGTLGPQPQPIPMAINLEGGSFLLSGSQLAGLPGDYGVRVLVSDGINTTALEVPKLFTITGATSVFLPLVTR
jgi:hypothetical protein